MESIDLFVYSLIIILITIISICLIYQILKCTANSGSNSSKTLILPTHERKILINGDNNLNNVQEIQRVVPKPKRNFYATNKVDEFIKLSITKSFANIDAYYASLRIIIDLTKTEKDLIIQEGAVPYLIKLFYDDWNLENVAAYSLSNLSLTDNKRSIQILINEGCIAALITGINSSNYTTCKLSAHAISNLRYKSEETFHEYIDSFLLPVLVKLLKSSLENRQMVAAQVITFVASRIQWKTIFATENIPLLVKFVDSSNALMCKKAVEALFYLTTNKAFTDAYTLEAKNNIIVAGAIPYLTKLLSSSDPQIISLSLSLLNNLSVGSNEHKQAVINFQALPNLVKLLSSSDIKICNKATIVILTLSSGTIDQKQAIINAGACNYLVKNLYSNYEDIVFATLFALTNLIYTKSVTQLQAVFEAKIIPALKRFLNPEMMKYCAHVLLILDVFTDELPVTITDISESDVVQNLIKILNYKRDNFKDVFEVVKQEGLNTVIQKNNIKYIVDTNGLKILYEASQIYKRAAKIIYKISTGTTKQRQTIIECNGIPEIVKLLNSSDKAIYWYTVEILDIFAKNIIIDQDVLIKTNSFQHIINFINSNVSKHGEGMAQTQTQLNNTVDIQKSPKVIDL